MTPGDEPASGGEPASRKRPRKRKRKRSGGGGPRRVALRALSAWQGRDGFLRDLLAAVDSGYAALGPRDRALARELSYGVCRHLRTLRHLIQKHANIPPERQDPDVRLVLLLGAYQLLFLDRVAPHAAVGETVALISNRRARGFCNAVLRALSRVPGERTDAAPPGVPVQRLLPLRGGRMLTLREALLPDWKSDNPQAVGIAFSFPDALAKRLLTALGPERARRVLAASNEVPPLTLRVLQDDPAEALRTIQAEGLTAKGVPGYPRALLLPAGTAFDRVPGFATGALIAQDLTAQQAAELVGAQPGERVLDLCAAPGGKALVLAAAVGPTGRVLAHDLSAERLGQLRDSARRAGLHERIEIRTGDALTEEGAPVGPFDRALVDAPCSNTGVLRRRVEARWRLPGVDLPQLAETQLALLERAAAVVRPGGLVVYATCSIEETENRGVAMAFLARHKDARIERELTVLPGDGPGDGGYAVALRL